MVYNWGVETYITLAANLLSLAGSYFIVRLDWKRYGALFLASGLTGLILCYIFVKTGLYSFPYRLFPQISVMPFESVLTFFPFLVVAGVRYSPRNWAYKIPFYWAFVHVGMLGETLAQTYTGLIKYRFGWDFWDSYTWWWIFLLVFEWAGSLLIPVHLRKPLDQEAFRYGKWAWAVFHFIVILTIFLGGYYFGLVSAGSFSY